VIDKLFVAGWLNLRYNEYVRNAPRASRGFPRASRPRQHTLLVDDENGLGGLLVDGFLSEAHGAVLLQ
jgi:hypothetical protein